MKSHTILDGMYEYSWDWMMDKGLGLGMTCEEEKEYGNRYPMNDMKFNVSLVLTFC